eukprot:gene29262-36282_t
MESVEQIQVDAFAGRPFSGNPAAVVFEHRDVEWMQNVALENNYAETAFLSKVPYVDNEYHLRWFTPNSEVDLCGHATLASAHALYETKRVPNRLQRITFHTLNSVSFANISVVNYALLEDFGGRGVIITCEGGARNGLTAEGSSISSTSIVLNSEYDFLSRFFAPRRVILFTCAINEDPVTGSAHCALAPYWFGRFRGDSTPKATLKAYQASSRGGVVHVALKTV